MESDVNCSVVTATNDTWRTILSAYDNEILFFDEDATYIYSEDFAISIQGTSNYYVFITRRPLYELPYSTQEIYGIRTTGRFHYPEQVYHTFYRLYPEGEGSRFGSIQKNS